MATTNFEPKAKEGFFSKFFKSGAPKPSAVTEVENTAVKPWETEARVIVAQVLKSTSKPIRINYEFDATTQRVVFKIDDIHFNRIGEVKIRSKYLTFSCRALNINEILGVIKDQKTKTTKEPEAAKTPFNNSYLCKNLGPICPNAPSLIVLTS